MAKVPSLSSQIMGKTLGGSKEEKTRAYGEAQKTLRETAEQEQKLLSIQEKLTKATGKEAELLQKQIEKQQEIVNQFQKKGAVAKNYISVLQVPISTWRSDMLKKTLKMEDKKSTMFFKALGKQWSGSEQMRSGLGKIFGPLSSLFSDFIPFFQGAKDMISGIKDVGAGAYKFFTGATRKEEKHNAIVDKLESTNDLAKQLKLNLVDLEAVEKQILDYAKSNFKASGKDRLKFTQQATADLAAAKAASIEDKLQTNIVNDPDWVDKNQELYQKMLDELKELKKAGQGGNAVAGEKWIRKGEQWTAKQTEILSEKIETIGGTGKKVVKDKKEKTMFAGLGGMFQRGDEDEDEEDIKDVRVVEQTSREIQNVRLISPTLREIGDEFSRALSTEGDRQESFRSRTAARTGVVKKATGGIMDWLKNFFPMLITKVGPLLTSAIATIGPLLAAAFSVLGPAIAVAAAGFIGYKVGGVINNALNKGVKAITGKDSAADLIYDWINGDKEKKADAEREAKLKEVNKKKIQNLLAAPSPTPSFSAAVEKGPGAIIPVPVSTPSTPSKTGISGDYGKLSLVAQSLKEKGFGEQATIASLANVMKETGGNIKSENLNYSSVKRIKEIFPSKVKGMSDEEIGKLVNNPEAMGNFMYGGRMGNVAEGEGYKYRGRGYIQLTGKSNYEKYSSAAGVDLVKNPDLANDPAIAAKITAAYLTDTKGAAARKLGLDVNTTNQSEQNKIITQAIGGNNLNLSKGPGAEYLAKVDTYSKQLTRNEAAGKTPDTGSAAMAIRASEKDVLLASAKQGIFTKETAPASSITSGPAAGGNLVMANKSSRGDNVPERWNLADTSMMHLVYQNTV